MSPGNEDYAASRQRCPEKPCCPLPTEGNTDGDYSIFFQAENMDTVLFVGWVTNAEIQLQALLQA